MKNCLFLFVAILFLSSCRPVTDFKDYPPVYKIGDNQLWAKKDFNDAGWAKERGNAKNNVFWVRTKVDLVKKPTGQLGLKIEAFGAFDVYWDGQIIGSNGQVISPQKAE
ncbi:MAG: regulator, partial [Pedobacter sp.]